MLSYEEKLIIVLGTPAYYRQFREYAKMTYSEENLDFIAAAEAYRKDPNKKKAIAIIDRFVNTTTTEQINVDSPTQDALIAAGGQYRQARQNAHQMGFFRRHWTANQRKAAENVFDQAVAHTRHLIAHDMLRVFLGKGPGLTIANEIAARSARAAGTHGALLEMGVG